MLSIAKYYDEEVEMRVTYVTKVYFNEDSYSWFDLCFCSHKSRKWHHETNINLRRLCGMNKGVTFGKNDTELVKKVTKYQHENEIPNFTEAVRKLLNLALKISEVGKEN
jgi:hypothetical protein